MPAHLSKEQQQTTPSVIEGPRWSLQDTCWSIPVAFEHPRPNGTAHCLQKQRQSFYASSFLTRTRLCFHVPRQQLADPSRVSCEVFGDTSGYLSTSSNTSVSEASFTKRWLLIVLRNVFLTACLAIQGQGMSVGFTHKGASLLVGAAPWA